MTLSPASRVAGANRGPADRKRVAKLKESAMAMPAAKLRPVRSRELQKLDDENVMLALVTASEVVLRLLWKLP